MTSLNYPTTFHQPFDRIHCPKVIEDTEHMRSPQAPKVHDLNLSNTNQPRTWSKLHLYSRSPSRHMSCVFFTFSFFCNTFLSMDLPGLQCTTHFHARLAVPQYLTVGPPYIVGTSYPNSQKTCFGPGVSLDRLWLLHSSTKGCASRRTSVCSFFWHHIQRRQRRIDARSAFVNMSLRLRSSPALFCLDSRINTFDLLNGASQFFEQIPVLGQTSAPTDPLI